MIPISVINESSAISDEDIRVRHQRRPRDRLRDARAWFGFKDATGPVDFQGHASSPFQVLSGGYAQKFGADGWQKITGDKARARGQKSRAPSAPHRARR